MEVDNAGIIIGISMREVGIFRNLMDQGCRFHWTIGVTPEQIAHNHAHGDLEAALLFFDTMTKSGGAGGISEAKSHIAQAERRITDTDSRLKEDEREHQ